MKLADLVSLLDAHLRPDLWQDVSHNGLQIANHGTISAIATAVDASLETMQTAVALGANCLIVHHGLSWGNSLARITDLNYRLVSYAITHDLAVYAMHLPLDAHPQLGNNAQLAERFDLVDRVPFMTYHGRKIGIKGSLPEPIAWLDFVAKAQAELAPAKLTLMPFGKETISTLGIVSGGAPEGVEQAAQEGIDCYLCGEPNLIAYNAAKALGINALFAGHYATERFGVKALGQWLKPQIDIPIHWVEFNISL